ncbi:MAG: hypothetical protein KA715_03810 [Xanthomonadaceae bacterium]|nr:hypothetical protein [Xanthomonadaceae bacterium]
MKFLLSFLVITVQVSSVHADLPATKWEPLNEAILAETLTTRCQLLYFKNATQCRMAAFALVEAMDIKRETTKGAIVAFYSDFVEMANSKWIARYLNFLETIAMNKLMEGSSYSLYDYTRYWVKKYRPEIKDADREVGKIIAVLYQDNASVLHLRYFDEFDKKAVPASVIETLFRVHNNILPSVMFNPDEKTFEGYFPPSVRALAKDFNPGIYYFYMPWYFSEKIREAYWGQSWIVAGLDRDLPLLLSTLYKYKFLYDGSYAKALLMPLVATSRIDSKGNLVSISRKSDGTIDNGWEWRYHDLYTAYVSTHVWRLKPQSTFSYKTFSRGIATRPGPTLLGVRFSQ